jgi:hypothetical protein
MEIAIESLMNTGGWCWISYIESFKPGKKSLRPADLLTLNGDLDDPLLFSTLHFASDCHFIALQMNSTATFSTPITPHFVDD